jgi:hypothetical protein
MATNRTWRRFPKRCKITPKLSMSFLASRCIRIHGLSFRNKLPFDFAQGSGPFDLALDRESFDCAQDREPVERLVERPVEPRDARSVLRVMCV